MWSWSRHQAQRAAVSFTVRPIREPEPTIMDPAFDEETITGADGETAAPDSEALGADAPAGYTPACPAPADDAAEEKQADSPVADAAVTEFLDAVSIMLEGLTAAR